MKKIYSNIGDKVCKLAMACGCIGIVCAVIGILAYFNAENDIAGIGGIVLIALGVFCTVSSWPLYAFGQITNDVHAMRTSAVTKTSDHKYSDLPEL